MPVLSFLLPPRCPSTVHRPTLCRSQPLQPHSRHPRHLQCGSGSRAPCTPRGWCKRTCVSVRTARTTIPCMLSMTCSSNGTVWRPRTTMNTARRNRTRWTGKCRMASAPPAANGQRLEDSFTNSFWMNSRKCSHRHSTTKFWECVVRPCISLDTLLKRF
jgi:hypothetical protein